MHNEQGFTTRIINLVQNLISNNDQDTQLESVLALMPGHVYWKDTKGRYLGCNDNFATTLGLRKRADIKGKTDHDFLPIEQADKITINDQKIITGKIPTEFEEQGYTPKHKHAVFLTQKIPLRTKDEKITGLVGISLDITERKALEKKLQTAKVQERLQEERIKAMKTLSAAIAHELRTPLRTISNNTNVKKHIPHLIKDYEIAKKTDPSLVDYGKEPFASIQEALDDISHEVNYANNFIDMLLVSFQELEAGTTSNTVCSINDCISSALERYPFSTSDERALVHWEPTEDFELLGRPLSVIHILFNLIKNALYFIAKAGKGDIKIWLEKNTKYNTLHFKDTGYGIASDILPGIFDQFSTTTTDGTGIGLTFCKVAMQNMRGNIACNSKEGEYTEFVLRFPKHKK